MLLLLLTPGVLSLTSSIPEGLIFQYSDKVNTQNYMITVTSHRLQSIGSRMLADTQILPQYLHISYIIHLYN